MIINVDNNLLLKSITITDSIISAKNISTILSNCCFNVSSGEIEIMATDNEIAIRTKIDAVSDSSVSFTANGKKFSSILKELHSDELTIDIDDSLVIDIKTKSPDINGHFRLIGTGTEDYPEIPEFNTEKSVEIEQSLLKEMLRKVIYAASHDTIKPVFNGVYFITETDRNLTIVATDSRRLSIITRKLSQDLKLDEGIIIPLKTVNEVFRLLELSGNCWFSYSKKQCFFKIGNTEIISRIVDGQFPNYKQVIPKDHVFEAFIDTKKLLEAIRRAMIFTREPANKIVMHFSGSTLTIEANTPDLGEAEEKVLIESNSKEAISIGINAQFLIETLKEIASDTIKCGITGQMSPVTISSENDDNYLAVIMPIQIKSSHSE